MKIFVSYRSTDRAVVSQLVTDLAGMGHEVWYDQELEGGQLWWQNILDNIRNADLLIFALTPRSLESYPCQLEYNYANALRRHIIPVMLAEGITYSLIPAVLQERQIVPYIKRDIDSYITLNTAIRRLPPAPPLPDPPPEAPAVPISPLATAREQVTRPALSYEEQAALLYQLKGYLGHEEYDSAARGVFERLSPRRCCPRRSIRWPRPTNHHPRRAGRINMRRSICGPASRSSPSTRPASWVARWRRWRSAQ